MSRKRRLYVMGGRRAAGTTLLVAEFDCHTEQALLPPRKPTGAKAEATKRWPPRLGSRIWTPSRDRSGRRTGSAGALGWGRWRCSPWHIHEIKKLVHGGGTRWRSRPIGLAGRQGRNIEAFLPPVEAR